MTLNLNNFAPLADTFGITMDHVRDFLHDISKISVSIIGETIKDNWVAVKHQGVSNKSNCLTATRLEHIDIKSQVGGAGVIKRHLQEFVKDVKHLNDLGSSIVKTRYYEADTGAKLFEIKSGDYAAPLDMSKCDLPDSDLMLVADFGHNLIDGNVAQHLSQHCKPLAVMAQSNSSNMGMNRIDKYPQANTYCLDRLELKILTNNQYLDMDTFLSNPDTGLKGQNIFVSLGSQGAALIQHISIRSGSPEIIRKALPYHVTIFPALAHTVVDTIGAGDAFFSFAPLFDAIDHRECYTPHFRLFIASIAGALNTQWLCNERHVTKDDFLTVAKYCLGAV